MMLFGHEPNVRDADVVARLNDPNEANVICALLGTFGVPASISSGSLPASVYPMNVGTVLVVVPLGMKEQALQIIEEHRVAGGLLSDLDASVWDDRSDVVE